MEERKPTEVQVLVVGVSGGELVVTAVNVGGPSDGSPVTIVDVLPAALRATGITGFDSYADEEFAFVLEFAGALVHGVGCGGAG